MPHLIRRKSQLATDTFEAEVEAPFVAKAWRPGQFIILMVDDQAGERIPLTVVDADRKAGTIRLIWQRVGKTTAQLADLEPGQSIAGIVGPLGSPTHIEYWGKVVCVAGGVGAAPLLPITSAIRQAGNQVIMILGARSKDRLILVDRLEAIADRLMVYTDDGSYGGKGMVTIPLEQVCREQRPDHVFVIGPAIMMKACCQITRRYEVPTTVSLNTIMVDGTGMCGGCRVEVAGKAKFVCVDGPEFDGHQVDFDLMIRRLEAYRDQERQAFEQYKAHKCRIGLS
ncbi:MAG: sulfide/dihydroorotate dehydrogenase-like FAD/NAD-binding protein [Sedimentisphaerales bacterium]|jgi:ferredoxin--NADP+ reductase|nr:sulfide/dihydroorotate dehydrogenase-like FAD/NAD-binding protein [Sedimentisphaerales bacterium]